MSMIKIRFLQEGSWADHPRDPIFDVFAGEEKEVSASLANVAIESGKAEYVLPEKPKQEPVLLEKPYKRSRKSGPTPKAES